MGNEANQKVKLTALEDDIKHVLEMCYSQYPCSTCQYGIYTSHWKHTVCEDCKERKEANAFVSATTKAVLPFIISRVKEVYA